MKKLIFFPVLFIFCLHCANALAASPIQNKIPAEENSQEDWVIMPSGAKPAYMGIHGGTMPVSLLVSDDGTSLFTFVGQTGNDFMEVLKNAYFPLPSFGNATAHNTLPWLAQHGRTRLFAGNATASMPVIAIPGDALAQMTDASQLQPFGLSHEPLSIEGEVLKPTVFPHAKTYRLFFMPDYFNPNRAKKDR